MKDISLLNISPILYSKSEPLSIKKRREKAVMTAFLQDCIVGHLLGDGYITKNAGKNTNARFGFGQSSKKEEYFQKVFSNFKVLCTPNTLPHTKFFITSNTNLSSISFMTIRLPCLNVYYDLFYSNGKREVPLNIIDLLNPLGLSY